jgi:hypothetical protein
VGILVLVLIISVGLNLYDHLIVFPQMQATINDMRVQALNGWLSKMELVKNILVQAETNFDVEDATVHTYRAKRFEEILSNEISIGKHGKELYYWVSKVTFYLDEALRKVYSGNQTGAVTERNLDQNVLTMIENVTTNIENLRSKTSSMQMIMWTTGLKGVEPTQQLREAEFLTDVLNYLEQIDQVSIEILDYYK